MWNAFSPGFELVSPCPIPATIIITPLATSLREVQYTTTGSWQTTRNMYIYKNIILYFYFLTTMLVWSKRAIRESSLIQQAVRSQNSQQKLNFSQNSRSYIVLKLPRDSRGHASWPMQCLFFISHGLYSHIFLCLRYHGHAFLLFQ